MAMKVIEEAMIAGARQVQACQLMGIDARTLRRWQKQLLASQEVQDQRKTAAADRVPANKLSETEKERIIEVCNLPEYKSLPPSQIVPMLADKGEYIASESSFYCILSAVNQVNRRGRAQRPKNSMKPKGYNATGPNQIWSWDITYLASTVRGTFYYLYLIEDIFSRKIVGWEIHERESAEHASQLISRVLKKSIHGLFQLEKTKMRFCLSSIFNDLWSLKMAAHPCAAIRLPKNGVFQQPCMSKK
ncbi:IS3 family transposase [Thiolapillus brandeum]|uniref:IS3 family transposase n=1 Tax=Thiolapillus brandeum TaxID=1076588 RepID=UPI000696A8C2|nr:IS3 family transposase [Thiolapillus brandeum]